MIPSLLPSFSFIRDFELIGLDDYDLSILNGETRGIYAAGLKLSINTIRQRTHQRLLGQRGSMNNFWRGS
jgi:hypothetical protein